MKLNAILEKSNTDINLISVFENTLAGYGGLSVSRISNVQYRINKAGAVPEWKTFLPNTIPIIYTAEDNTQTGHLTLQRLSDDYIDVFAYSSNGLPIEDVCDWTISISIETYP